MLTSTSFDSKKFLMPNFLFSTFTSLLLQSMSVCLCVSIHVYQKPHSQFRGISPNLANFLSMLSVSTSSWWHCEFCDMLCTSRHVNDTMFHIMGSIAQQRNSSSSKLKAIHYWPQTTNRKSYLTSQMKPSSCCSNDKKCPKSPMAPTDFGMWYINLCNLQIQWTEH